MRFFAELTTYAGHACSALQSTLAEAKVELMTRHCASPPARGAAALRNRGARRRGGGGLLPSPHSSCGSFCYSCASCATQTKTEARSSSKLSLFSAVWSPAPVYSCNLTVKMRYNRRKHVKHVRDTISYDTCMLKCELRTQIQYSMCNSYNCHVKFSPIPVPRCVLGVRFALCTRHAVHAPPCHRVR
jgi:hypothetical protein